jgi:hypothetical protein
MTVEKEKKEKEKKEKKGKEEEVRPKSDVLNFWRPRGRKRIRVFDDNSTTTQQWHPF